MVTGASSGIGAAAARLFSAEGAAVVLTARRGAELERLAGELTAAGGSALAVPGDVCSSDDVRRVVEAAVERFGRLDAAFNNAGWGTPRTPLHLLPDEEYDAIMDVNVRGVWNCLKHQIPVLLDNASGGSIVITSSAAGVAAPAVPSAPYVAAKHAVIGLARAAAHEYGSRGVRVNALVVGATRTELMQTAFDHDPRLEEYVTESSMLKRIAEPEEVARAAVWLCGDHASFVSGAAIAVDGGCTAL
ncbi:SDR family oxidoreductase [Streptomyces sp. TRM 70351]|uniref:SDR family oxidoreductase n=1 Tax=Streptomyces sp. TRM 70351 TaxID=3116552 RepID=UPI002E7BD919|nr:SDR family oxidoreductase [Streptomyces sp. TRM 70351]MEE1930422.1 SDR family oxidoreductase [Streptomyces sp. TRM 70351]